tara:strand:- start:35 stop:1774 length:1740 start_codon:yes stop_codon:yes gene_type:complete
MTSTYTSNSGIEKPGTGDQSGTWGDTTNTNMDIIDRAISGVVSLSLTGTSTTLTTTDGSLTDGMYKVLVLAGSPTGANTITIAPNDADKFYLVKNGSGESAVFSQGTGANVTIPDGGADIIFSDGAGTGAAVASIFANSLSFGKVNLTSDTASGDAAALGYTAAEGLILTGQGSTNDVTIKNDADADVLEIPTGSTNVTVVGDITAGGTLNAAGDTSAGDDAAIGYTAALGLILTGQGSTNDVTIVNDADATVLSVATGGTDVDIVGNVTAATVNADGDTSAGDNAAMGYTAAEGLILTGQGSTNDVTIKNDADADVITIPTGTTAAVFAGNMRMTKGGDIASASPLVIDTDGNYFDVTGTTNFAAMTVAAGNFFMLQFDGALTITHGSGIEIPGGADLTTAAGDRLICYATAADTVEVMNVATEAASGGGKVLQVVEVHDGAVATGSTIMPSDDTIPQNSEGNEWMTLAVTPASASNLLRIDTCVHMATTSDDQMIAAIFQDSTASALSASAYRQSAANKINSVYMTHYMTAGTTSSTTFKVRGGGMNSGTITFNGVSSGRLFGGVLASFIIITEIEA